MMADWTLSDLVRFGPCAIFLCRKVPFAGRTLPSLAHRGANAKAPTHVQRTECSEWSFFSLSPVVAYKTELICPLGPRTTLPRRPPPPYAMSEKAGSPPFQDVKHDIDSVSVVIDDEKNTDSTESYIEGSEGVTQHDLDTLRQVGDTLPLSAWLVIVVEFAERYVLYLSMRVAFF